MHTWIFKLYDVKNKTTYPLKYDIDEWKSFGVTYGREKKTGIIKSYSAGFTFIKEDADYLKNIVITKGFNELIRLNVYRKQALKGEILEYSGYLQLSTAEMTGKTFNCMIYSGGFFTAIDNNWDTEFEIKNNYSPNIEEFRDIVFDGGEYQYNEKLGLVRTDQYGGTDQLKGDVLIPMKKNDQAINFLPVKKIDDTNSKINFFHAANAKTVLNNNKEVTEDVCFIISPDKLNGGKLKLNLMDTLGIIEIPDVEIKDIIKQPIINLHLYLEVQINVYLWNIANRIGGNWWASEGLLNSFRWERSMILPWSWGTIPNDGKMSLSFKGFNLGEYIVDIDGYLNQPINGYMAAVALTFTSSQIGIANQLVNNLGLVLVDNKDVHTINYYPNHNFIIEYSNDAFKLNANRRIHGIRPVDLFNNLIRKLNTGIVRTIDTGNVFQMEGRFNVSVSNTVLKSKTDQYIIASGTTLLGSRFQIQTSQIASSVITSLEDFTDFIYKVFGLQFIVTYNKDTGWYNVFFQKMEDCYQNSEIQQLEHINNITLTADRDNLYSMIKVGYKNKENSIFGYFEFNTINNFKTGNTEIESNELDLVPEYTAGAMDIETFIHENSGNFEDTNQGSDEIYVIETEEINGKIKSKRYDVNSNYVMKTINVSLTPKRILSAHDRELSSYFYFSRILEFITTQRNADFSYMNIRENDNYQLSGNAYTKPFIIELSVPAVYGIIEKIEKNPFGYFKFNYNGNICKGYIANGTESITVNPMSEQESVIKLIAHKDSSL